MSKTIVKHFAFANHSKVVKQSLAVWKVSMYQLQFVNILGPTSSLRTFPLNNISCFPGKTKAIAF